MKVWELLAMQKGQKNDQVKIEPGQKTSTSKTDERTHDGVHFLGKFL
jgi:hypothetical protein